MTGGLNPKAWEKMIQVSSDMSCAFDRGGYFIYASDASKRILGYSSEELIGRHYSEFLHPDYLQATREALQSVLRNTSANDIENCYIHKDGSVVSVSWSALWCEEDGTIFCIARDVTELKKSRLRLEESQQLYKALFEYNPDVLFIQNKEGLVQEVNQSFCDIFGISREEAMDRPTTSFLPPEMVPLCQMYLGQALQGHMVRYDLELCTANGERRLFDVSKTPITSGGEVAYVHTILKDITTVVRSYEKLSRQAKKLNSIFESITDAFFTLDRNWNYTYTNSEFDRILNVERRSLEGKNIWEVFPDGVNGIFHQKYRYAMVTGKSVHFEAFSQELQLWLELRVYPTEEGIAVYFTDNTEQKRIQQELEKLSLVASNTTNGVIITDPERRIEWVNKSFTRLTGYSPEEAIGKRPSELLHVHASSIQAFEAISQEIVKGKPVSFEILNHRKNGEEIWFSVQVNPVYNEAGQLVRYITIQTDITERVRARQELEMLSLVASNTDNGVVITDANGLTEWVNEGFVKITGYTLPEIRGRKPGELLQGEGTQADAVKKIRNNLKQGTHFSTTLINYKKSGERFWVSMDITPIFDNDGAITRFIAIQRDITFRKEAEDSLMKMTQDLYSHNSDLQQFTYIVSHNLRAPVANALGLTRLLTSIGKHSGQFDQALSNLSQSVVNLDTVLKDINMILSIRDSRGNLELEPIALKLVVQQALSSLQESLRQCGGTVLNAIPDDLTVRANKAYLYSVFYNLLSNAIKYRSEKRALVLQIRCYGDSGKGVLVSLSDNGSGFDMQKANKNMFKLYKRFHSDKKGRGIGLYLVKTHLEAMGGHIEVNSQVGVGTKFLIYLAKV
ncbi:MAG: PAS domain-containing sensor histidine kinase [Hymenobacteraceae bacterium]|nr:PAS domain-containing sensor histidine kinase [Hymenobacteraceae bacterium]MDX5480761.1 PAS domain-containing sensor histidine kinase [Hymenobacteraceae bacterium]